MSQLTKQQLKGENQTQFPNNNVGAITPSHLRAFNVDMIDSTVNQTDFTNFSGSVAGEFASLTASADPSITGSSLITASFDNGTRNLTFTKGDASTFAVNIPDVSGSTLNTGSFATTGSNNFIGNQNVDGRVIISGSSVLTNNNYLLFTRPGAGDIFRIGMSDNGQTYDFTVTGSTHQQLWLIDNQGGTFINNFTAPIIASNNVRLDGGFTASLQNGYAWVGNASGKNSQVPTSSFSGGGGSIDTASFATTGSNTFTGNQTINAELILTSSKYFRIGASQSISEGIVGTGLLIESQNGLLVRNLSGAGNITLQNTQGDTTIIGNRTYVYSTGDVGVSGSRTLIQDVDFIPFSSSVNSRINAITGSAGTTYTNPSLNPYSGSLVLVANTFTSSSFAHISASANGQVNLVFKNNNNTGTTILSGSNNIFTNPGAPSAGFIRYIGGSDNLIQNANAVPQITASAQFSPTFNSNIINSNNTNFFMRAPVSTSGTWLIRNNYLGGSTVNIGTGAIQNPGIFGLNFLNNVSAGATITFTTPINLATTTGFSNNFINGAPTLNLNSSSVALASSNINDTSFTINNNAYDSSTGGGAGTGSLVFSRLNIGGFGNTITARNNGTASSYSDNVIFGANNSIAIDLSQTNNAFNANNILGKNLIVTASGVFPDANGQFVGSMFIGRNNAVDGNKALTAQTIFAVGTGTNTTTGRKTGFLIDSASNTFVEGTLNVSGSTTMTGSLLISSSATYDLIITGAARVASQDGLQTNTIGANTFNIDTTRDASVNAENYIFGSTASVSSIYVGVYDSPAFNTDVELKVSADSNGLSFNDWDNVDGAYESWLTLDANVGTNPIPKFTRGLNVSGSTTLSGSLYIQSGSTLPVSTGSAILTWDVATGQVKQAPFSTIVSASVSSAEFWSTTTQSGSAGVSGSITFNNSGSFYNVSLVNGKELKVANAGVYNIQFSAQIETSAGADTIYLWFKKNGTNIGASASKAVLANNTAQIMTVNILDEAAANDYYEIAYQNVNGHATVLAEAASGNIPAIPSVIATIIQVR